MKNIFNELKNIIIAPIQNRRESFARSRNLCDLVFVQNTDQSSSSGFVILFTILISVIVLLLGLGIFSISTKELQLTSFARESHIAFTAADTGTECVLLAESRGEISSALLARQSTEITCIDGKKHELKHGLGPSSTDYLSGFIPLPSTLGAGIPTCAQVVMFKDQDGIRVVRSRGFNVCSDNGEPLMNDPRLVERVLEFTFFAGSGAISPGGGSTGGDSTDVGDVGGIIE